jgi:hypothetical protein
VPPRIADPRKPMIRLVLNLLLVASVTSCGGGESLVPAAASTPVVATRTEVGVNLPGISDWSSTPVYVDLVRQGRRFGTPDTPWDEAATLGADGWPIGDFGILLMTGQSRVSGTGGTYRVSFRGRATVDVVSSNARVANQVHDEARNRTTLDVVVPQGADQLALKFTQTRGGIQSLEVIRPGYSLDDPPLFTRAFLEHVGRFKTLRFMDWLATNVDNGIVSWGSRATPERVPYASKLGVPWEHVIALANETRADIWINIPVRADDDYVRQLARLLRSTLRPESRIYVEYSNELWNAGFPQYRLNIDMAEAEVRANPRSELAYDHATDPGRLGVRRAAKRLKQISDIFRDEYGGAAMMSTIRPVLGGQVVQPYLAEAGLAFVDAVYGPPARYFYAVAGAPYFNLGSRQTVDGLTVDEVLQAMEDSVAHVATVNAFERNRGLATWYGLRWLAYEGGADTFGAGSIAAKAAANMDPRIEDLCLDKAMGGPAASTGGRNSVPGSFAATAYLGSSASRGETMLRQLHPGRYVDYLVHADRAGVFALTLTTEAAAPGNAVAIAVNNAPAATVALAVTGWGSPAPQPAVPVRLNRGFNTLRITTRSATTGYALQRLELR